MTQILGWTVPIAPAWVFIGFVLALAIEIPLRAYLGEWFGQWWAQRKREWRDY